MNQNDQNDNYCASTLGVSAQADHKGNISWIFVLLRKLRFVRIYFDTPSFDVWPDHKIQSSKFVDIL